MPPGRRTTPALRATATPAIINVATYAERGRATTEFDDRQ